MRVCVVTDKPDHPVLATAVELLSAGHQMSFLDPDAPVHETLLKRHEGQPAPLYLLKAHTRRALDFAASAEQRGARVINTAAATERCQDRVTMARVALAAGLPFPRTRPVQRLADLFNRSRRPEVRFPLIVKSRQSRRADLVAKAHDSEELSRLAREWPDEAVIVQDFAANRGWDHKLWVVGSEVFAALRPTPLHGGPRAPTRALDPGDLPSAWHDVVRAAGVAFGLEVYGVDIIATPQGPLIVDINAFPGGRGVPGVPEALAALVEASLQEVGHARRTATV